MKRFYLIVALFLSVLIVTPAYGQLRFGVKLGANVTKLSTEIKNFEFDNSSLANFTGGVTLEWMIGGGIGVDAGALYTVKGSEYVIGDNFGEFVGELSGGVLKNTVHYIEVPINLKYKLCVPGIQRIFIPYFYAGPGFSFKVGDTVEHSGDLPFTIKNSNLEYTLNLGFGMEFIRHLNVTVQYGWGLSKASDLAFLDRVLDEVAIKSGSWTIHVGWMF